MLNCEGLKSEPVAKNFSISRGSNDNKDLWADKHILNSILTFIGKKFNSIGLGVIIRYPIHVAQIIFINIYSLKCVFAIYNKDIYKYYMRYIYGISYNNSFCAIPRHIYIYFHISIQSHLKTVLICIL